MTDHTAVRYDNALTGGAAGDAWGYQVEFARYRSLPPYPGVPAPQRVWRISDDTQMTLALHQALLDVADRLDDLDGAVTEAIVSRFLFWHNDPDNTRAPGISCTASMVALSRGARWQDPDGAVNGHGCGAVMRLVPAAFVPVPQWRAISALQAVITHKNPRAVASALVLADAVRFAPGLRGRFLERAIANVVAVLHGHSRWLNDPFLVAVLSPVTRDVREFLTAGIVGGLHSQLRAARAAKARLAGLSPDRFGDPCSGIGLGWDADSATALGLLIADMVTGEEAALDGRAALQWAATSDGDSDSIAGIAGGLIGSAHTEANYWAGVGVRPEFEPRYADELDAAPVQWHNAFGTYRALTGAVR